MKQPLANLAFAYAAGLLLAQLFQPSLPLLFCSAFLVFIFALTIKKLRSFLIWPLIALVGWTNFATRTAIISPNDIRTIIGNEPAIVTVRGQLKTTPRLKISERHGEEFWRNVATIEVQEISKNETFFPATGEVLVTTPGILAANFFAGQPIEIIGVLARPPTPIAAGLFDFQNYLAARGIFYQLKTEGTNDWKILEPQRKSPPLTDRFLNWSQQTLAVGLPNEDEPLRLLWAMTLGWRTAFTGEIGDPFLQAGTMHLFAVDGLRIALLSGLILTFLRVLQLSRSWCGAIAIPLIWFYTAATGWEPSAIRASVMMTIVLGGWAIKRPGDLLNSLAASALFILIWDPRQFFEASFQLSFFVMLIIALMLPPLNAYFDRVLRYDPLLPAELQANWQRLGFWLTRHLARYCGLSFAAWLGSLPLSAKYFHLFSPVSTLANVLAVPLGTAALTANLGALFCGHWLPWFTDLFNHAAWFFMVAMTWVSVAATKIPGAFCYVAEPSWWTVMLYYVALIAIFTGKFNSWPRKSFGVAILVFIGTIYFWQWSTTRNETHLTVLPLNGGHAIYVDNKELNDNWLINCGNENSVRFTLKEFLHAQGVNHISQLVLTEGDIKKCGGATLLDEAFSVGKLWTSHEKFRSTAYRDSVAYFEKSPSRHVFFNTGETNGVWEVLFPLTATKYAKADDSPLVLRGDFHGIRILLLSDLSRSGQSELLENASDLRSDIVIAGLPTQGEPLCNVLIDAIKPRVIVIADSLQPATRRASRTLQTRLAEQKIPVIYTRTAGAVSLIFKNTGWQLTTSDDQYFDSSVWH